MAAAIRHGVSCLTGAEHREDAASENAFPAALETPTPPELRTEHTPPATAFNRQGGTIAYGTTIAIGDHGNECLRREPDEDNSDEDEEGDERCRIAPAPAAPGSQEVAAVVRGVAPRVPTARRMRRRSLHVR